MSELVIQCATPQEFEILRQEFKANTIERAGKREFFVTPKGWVVVRGAVGKVWAAASAEFAISRWNPKVMVDFGAAGGLVEGLEIGDIVVAEQVIEHDVISMSARLPKVFSSIRETVFEKIPLYPDFTRIERRNSSPRLMRGCLAAGDQDIQTRPARADLHSKTGAIAVAWECSAIGRVCNFHEVPYLSVRVVTDLGIAATYEEYREHSFNALKPAAGVLAEWLGQ